MVKQANLEPSMSKPKRRTPTKGDPLPLSELNTPLKGIIGTPKAEVDAEERKRRRQKPQKRSSTRRKQSR